MTDHRSNDLAQTELLALLGSAPETSFTVTINHHNGRWTITTADHDPAGSGSAKGKGASFAEAWTRQLPAWARPANAA